MVTTIREIINPLSKFNVYQICWRQWKWKENDYYSHLCYQAWPVTYSQNRHRHTIAKKEITKSISSELSLFHKHVLQHCPTHYELKHCPMKKTWQEENSLGVSGRQQSLYYTLIWQSNNALSTWNASGTTAVPKCNAIPLTDLL